MTIKKGKAKPRSIFIRWLMHEIHCWADYADAEGNSYTCLRRRWHWGRHHGTLDSEIMVKFAEEADNP